MCNVSKPLVEPLPRSEARRLIKAALDEEDLIFEGHILTRMKKRQLTPRQIETVLRSGDVGVAYWEDNAYRHDVTHEIGTAVVKFRSPDDVVICTAWRKT